MKLRPVMVETCEMNSRMSAFFRLIFHVSSVADADNSSVDKATRRHHLTLTMGERANAGSVSLLDPGSLRYGNGQKKSTSFSLHLDSSATRGANLVKKSGVIHGNANGHPIHGNDYITRLQTSAGDG